MNSKREATRVCSLFPRFGVDLIRASVHLRVDQKKIQREREEEKKAVFARYAKKRFSLIFFF